MLKKCEICGKEFKTFKSTQHKKKYCSEECRKKITHMDAKCLFCGKTYSVACSRYFKHGNRHKCCSRECYEKNHIVEKSQLQEKHTHKCTNCGKVFYGIRAGKTIYKFCSQECSKSFMRGEKAVGYKNGYTINASGYKCIQLDNKYVYEHRQIMEEYIGRKLEKHEVVHHKDENKLNNCIENLQLMTKREHDKLHNEKRNSK